MIQRFTTSLPRFGTDTLLTVILAGCAATVAFEYFGNSLSPMLGYSKLAPVPLANNTIKVLTGSGYAPGAHLLHYLAGVLAYPLGWLLLARPLAKTFTPALPWLVTATLYGTALWVFALYVMAHLIAGNPPFLNFSGLTWVALVGHIIYALVAAWVIEWREQPAIHSAPV